MLTVNNLFGQKLPVWALDFETYYNTKDKYSLTNLSTIEYVRDPRFKAHGVAVRDPEGFLFWVTHKDLPKFFASIDWDKAAVLCHHVNFDGFILSEIYGILPNYYLDTMGMSRGEWGPGVKASLDALDRRLGGPGKMAGVLESTNGIRDLSCEEERVLVPYALQDVERMCYDFEKLYFDRGYPEQELHVIDMTAKTFVRPLLRLNAGLCRAEIEDEDRRMQALLSSDLVKGVELSQTCREKVEQEGIEALMRSRPCFAELLRSRGVAPPMKEQMKNGEPTGELTYAFAKTDQELLALQDDPRVSDLVAAWIGLKSTIRKSRAEKFLKVTDDGRKTLPIPLVYAGGRTLRWSGSENLNPQNLSSGRDGRGSRLREAIEAPPGYSVVVVDSAQIELRCSAYVSRELELLDELRHDGDPYSGLASEIFGVPVGKKGPNPHLRHVGKEGELSLQFGVGALKFFSTVQTKYNLDASLFTLEKAQEAVNLYRGKRVGVVQAWNELRDALHHMAAGAEPYVWKGIFRIEPDRVMLPNQLYLNYPELHWKYDKEKGQGGYVYKFKEDWVKIYAAKLYENIIQAVARCIVAEQALEISKCYPVVLLVHDEVVFLAPEDEAAEAFAWAVKVLSIPPTWWSDIPLAAEGGWAKCYSK